MQIKKLISMVIITLFIATGMTVPVEGCCMTGASAHKAAVSCQCCAGAQEKECKCHHSTDQLNKNGKHLCHCGCTTPTKGEQGATSTSSGEYQAPAKPFQKVAVGVKDQTPAVRAGDGSLLRETPYLLKCIHSTRLLN